MSNGRGIACVCKSEHLIDETGCVAQSISLGATMGVVQGDPRAVLHGDDGPRHSDHGERCRRAGSGHVAKDTLAALAMHAHAV